MKLFRSVDVRLEVRKDRKIGGQPSAAPAKPHKAGSRDYTEPVTLPLLTWTFRTRCVYAVNLDLGKKRST